MSLSQSRDQESGSAALPGDHPRSQTNSPEHSSFTSFPEGERATKPDIPPEPMFNKLYNKVLSLTTAGKSLSTPVVQQQQPVEDAKSSVQVTGMGLGISLDIHHQSKSSSVTSLGAESTDPAPSNPPPVLEKMDSNSNRQTVIRPAEKNPDVLAPILSPVHAVGGLTRSEDEFSNLGSEKALSEAGKHQQKLTYRES